VRESAGFHSESSFGNAKIDGINDRVMGAFREFPYTCPFLLKIPANTKGKRIKCDDNVNQIKNCNNKKEKKQQKRKEKKKTVTTEAKPITVISYIKDNNNDNSNYNNNNIRIILYKHTRARIHKHRKMEKLQK